MYYGCTDGCDVLILKYPRISKCLNRVEILSSGILYKGLGKKKVIVIVIE